MFQGAAVALSFFKFPMCRIFEIIVSLNDSIRGIFDIFLIPPLGVTKARHFHIVYIGTLIFL